MTLFAAIFFVAFAVFLVYKRRELADMQGLVAGGRIAPGCVIAEAVLMLLIGIAIALFG